MTLVDGLILGILGTLLTIVGFGFAFWISNYEKKEKLDKHNPIYRFWKDYKEK